MRTNHVLRILSLAVLMMMFFSPFGATDIALAGSSNNQNVAGSGPQVIPAVSFDTSQSLNLVTPIPLAGTPIKPRTRLTAPKIGRAHV